MLEQAREVKGTDPAALAAQFNNGMQPTAAARPRLMPGVRRIGESVTRMNYSLSSIRWFRVLGAAIAVIAVSFLILIVVVTVYAFVLAFQARGAPDQNAINHFAERVSPKLMPWLEMLLTLVMALIVARRAEKASIIHGLFIGILAGLLSLAVTLAFGGRLGLRDLVFFLTVVGLGWLGGFVGQKKTGRT